MESVLSFQKRYDNLNAAQKEAVDTIEGPVMVIAGPGTGKTELLTIRIANILQKTDTPASGILALTFTEAGARNMRERLRGLIGSRAFEVAIHTFHGLCGELIARNPDRYPTIVGATLAGDVEKIAVISDVLQSGTWEHLMPSGDPLYYVEHLMRAFSDLKRENVSATVLREWAEREKAQIMAAEDLYHTKGKYAGKMKGAYETELRRYEKSIELSTAFGAYSTLMHERRLYDFDDLILETISALTGNESFLRELQERFLYVLADEHQDANGAQNTLLELLASFHESPNLFVVGDDKQAIFRFQGASLANFMYFKRRFTDAKIIILSENYRSTQSILDSAHSLATAASTPEDLPRVPLTAIRGEGTPISVSVYAREEDELAGLADAVSEAIAQEVSPSQIAVIYRTNRDSALVSRALSERGITHAIESDFDVLADPHILQFISLLRAIEHLGDDAYVAPVVYFAFLGIEPLAAHSIIEKARAAREPIAALLSRATDVPEALARLGASLPKWVTESREKTLPEFIDAVARESGFLAWLVAHPSAPEKLGKVRSLYSIAEALSTTNRAAGLGDFLTHLSVMMEHRVRISASAGTASPNEVRLMTAHKSKGLEFDRVFVIGVTDSAWGGSRHSSMFHIPYGADGISAGESIDDDRRLLYVAFTRARHALWVSYHETRIDGKSMKRSRLLDEIDPALITELDRRDTRAPIALSVATRENPIRDQAYLQELFLKRGLTITALNNYRECPWRYFFLNLIRLPSPKSESAYFGSAVHAALSAAIKAKGENAQSKGHAALERSLLRAPLPEHAYKRLYKRAIQSVDGLYGARPERFMEGVQSEVRVTVEFPISGIPEPLLLTGDIDCLDTHDPRNPMVIDFKTGRAKSRGDIEGTTKAKRSGDYLRQLLFYRFLLESSGAEYLPKIGAIDFVEPDKRGEFKSEVFPLTDALTNDVIEYTKETALSIYTLSFFEVGDCNERTCEFCGLRRALMEPRG